MAQTKNNLAEQTGNLGSEAIQNLDKEAADITPPQVKNISNEDCVTASEIIKLLQGFYNQLMENCSVPVNTFTKLNLILERVNNMKIEEAPTKFKPAITEFIKIIKTEIQKQPSTPNNNLDQTVRSIAGNGFVNIRTAK